MVAFPAAIEYPVPALDDAAVTLAIGARAPSFAGLLGADGHRYGLSDFADKEIVVLIFSSNRCPTVKSHTERLLRFQEEYGPRGVQLILINSNDPHLYRDERYERMTAVADAAGYTFPYLADPDQQVARGYGPTRTFHAFVLDGTRRLRYEGRFDDARVDANVTATDVADAVDALLAGRDVSVERTIPFGCSLDIIGAAPPRASSGMTAANYLWVLIGGAWVVMTLAQLSGAGAHLVHGALIENGPPLPAAAVLSTGGFLVMTLGMMLPASLRAIGSFASDFSFGRHPISALRPVTGFVTGYLGIWALFGLACFVGDSVVHRVVDSSPWLTAHAYLIAAGVFGLAGVYQWLPIKDRCLAACRNPLVASHRGSAALAAGGAHGIDCVLSSGPLMLLMFAAGIANIGWMVALTALMTYETTGRKGRIVSRAAGLALIVIGLVCLTTPSVAALLAE